MLLKLTIDERDTNAATNAYSSLRQQLDEEHIAVFTELTVYDDDGLTWMRLVRDVVQSLEEHFGYKFDRVKLAEALK